MVKILKDNNRVIIIVEDDGNIDMTQLTNNIISKAMEMSQPIQNNEVEGLTKIEEETIENIEEITKNMQEIEAVNNVVSELIENERNEERRIKEGDIPGDKYVGMTPKEAIMSDYTLYGEDTIAVDLYCNCNQIQNIALKRQMIKVLKEYIYNRFNDDLNQEKISQIDKNYISSFFIVYEPIIKGEIKNILEQDGFAELTDFLNDSDLFTLKGAYYNTIKNLMDRLKL